MIKTNFLPLYQEQLQTLTFLPGQGRHLRAGWGRQDRTFLCSFDLPPLGCTERAVSLPDIKPGERGFLQLGRGQGGSSARITTSPIFSFIKMLIPWVPFQPSEPGGRALKPAF